MFGTYLYGWTLRNAISSGKPVIKIGTAKQCQQNLQNHAKMIQTLIDNGYVKLGIGNTTWCTKEYKEKLKANGN